MRLTGPSVPPPRSVYEFESPRRIVGMIFFYFGILAACGLAVYAYHELLTPPMPGAPSEEFVVAKNTSFDALPHMLAIKGLIRNEWEFRLAASLSGLSAVLPGGYELSGGSDVFDIVDTLKRPPSSVWVTIPEGFRKEQIGTLLQNALGWDAAAVVQWVTTATDSPPEYVEGVYFPDTYLIPRTDSPDDVARQLQARFNEVFAPYAAQAAAKNIPWTDVVTFASLLTRESGAKDMPLIAGILWNRLDKNMPLQVDATLQYAAGQSKNGVWWSVATPAMKALASPYNTYKNRGLPPHPIAEPGLKAIEAVLNPTKTSCLYYLHDAKGTMHCSPTYAGHLANIRRYLQ